MTPFVTNTEFLIRYDGRWVGKNLNDDGTAATISQMQNESSAPGLVLKSLISEASELLMGAAAVGARYSEADLRTYGGSLLTRIVSDLTVGLILKRRARALTDQDALSQSYNEALQYLEQLRRGERIFFAVPDVSEAGVGDTADMTPRPGIDAPTISQQSGRYFGCPAASDGGGTWGGNPYYPNPG